MNKRVFYFNVTYSCNNACVFCYSHNTRLEKQPYNEMAMAAFYEYLKCNQVSSGDRVVLNGGEPLLHSNINEMLEILDTIGCEVVVFTNGRLLNRINNQSLNEKFRFVVPIHGSERLHDEITRAKGSYGETVMAMKHLTDSSNGSLIDLKIIINNSMIITDKSFEECLYAFDEVPINNAVHITKMADTIVSRRNGCVSLSNDNVSRYTRILLEHFLEKKRAVKIFDTCIKTINWLESSKVEKFCYPIEMKGKDFRKEEDIKLFRKPCKCYKDCSNSKLCLSSVSEYKVLEFFGGKVYESME